MEHGIHGKILKGVGGLYTVRLSEDAPLDEGTVLCHAGGAFRHNNQKPLVGDEVELVWGESSTDETDVRIARILDRRNSLIRPPLANLDVLFVSMAAAFPEPVLPTVDKLICIAEHNGIEPVIVIGKCDLAPERAEELRAIYANAGFDAFVLSARSGVGVEKLAEYVNEHLVGKTAAFAGASGIGKSTLLNALFPSLSLATNTISERIERGRHTTRHVELYPISDAPNSGYIADTPGFSLLDFERFNFFDVEDLAYNMREFRPYLGRCRYTKCTHTKEEGCAVLEAIKEGEISRSRHDSFLEIYSSLKNKKKWGR